MSRIEDLERRLAKDPNSKIFAQLAEEYRKSGRLEDAINTCREGLQNHPNYFSARVALGRALLEFNALEEASQEFEAVLAQVPDNILANKFLGRTYHELGRFSDALEKYQIAHTLAPEDAELSDHIGEVETEVSRGSRPAAGPAPVAVYDDPSVFDFEESEKEPTLVEAELDPPPVPLQPASHEAVFDFEGDDPTVSERIVSEDDASSPDTLAEPLPAKPTGPIEPTEVVYDFEGGEPAGRQPTDGSGEPQAGSMPSIQLPSEGSGEVVYELDGSESAEPHGSRAAPIEPAPESPPGEIVYEFEDGPATVTKQPTSAPIPPREVPTQEPVFEIEGAEPSVDKTPTRETYSTPTVSDEARAIQERFEQSVPTGVVKRQVREIQDSARAPKPRGLEAPEEISAEPALHTTFEPDGSRADEPVYEIEGEGVAGPMVENELIASDTPQAIEPLSGPVVPPLPESKSEPVAAEKPSEVGTGVTTATLAELYASQGHLEQALDVYRELMTVEPEDGKLRQRFEELQMLIQAKAEVVRGTDGPAEVASTAGARDIRDTLRILEAWLAAIKRS